MSYTYDAIEAYRQTAAVLAFLVCFLAFLGGYYSGLLGWKWMGLSVLLIGWKIHKFLTVENPGEVKIKMYDKIILAAVYAAVIIFFALIFAFGYFMGPFGAWWAGLPLLIVYFLTAKYIHKPRKKNSYGV